MPIDGNILVRSLLRYRTQLLAYILAIVHDDHLAEDIYQDVSSLAYEKREQIDGEAALPGWLRTTARYQSLRAVRQRSARPRVLDAHVLDLLESDWPALDAQDSAHRIAVLRDCLARLSPYARRLVELRYGEGVSGEKLARRMSRDLNTIYVALTRAHRSLSECVRRRLAREAAR